MNREMEYLTQSRLGLQRTTWLFLCLGCLGADTVGAGDTVVDPVFAAGDRIARAARLADFGCPLGESLSIPSYFHQQRDGESFEAHAAVVLPLPYPEAAETILGIERYPEWALAGVDGTPRLEEFRFDRSAGIHEIRLAQLLDEPIRARVRQIRGSGRAGVHFSPTETEGMAGMFLDATVVPAGGCPQASLVTLRLRWEVGWLGRLVAGKVTRSPAMFLLKIRGDLIAHALNTPDNRTRLLSGKGERDDEGWSYTGPSPAGRKEMRLGWVYPAFVELPPGRVEQLASQIRKVRKGSRKFGDHVSLLLDALEGRHRITGYRVELTGEGRPAFTTVGDRATMSYDVFLQFSEAGAGFGISVHFTED